MPHDLRIWVAEKKSETGAKTSQLADDYIQARRQAPWMGGGGGEMEKTCACATSVNTKGTWHVTTVEKTTAEILRRAVSPTRYSSSQRESE